MDQRRDAGAGITDQSGVDARHDIAGLGFRFGQHAAPRIDDDRMAKGVAAILVVGYVLLYADPDEGWLAQASMMGGVTVLVVSSLLAVQVLAVPFSGESGSITPASMEYALVQMDQFAKAEGTAPEVYCNKVGLPLAK